VAVPVTEPTLETDCNVESPEFLRENVALAENVESPEIQKDQENFNLSTASVTKTEPASEKELNLDLDLPIFPQEQPRVERTRGPQCPKFKVL